MGDLRGRIGVVTGASSGIGRAVAIQLIADGARVVGCARRADRLVALEAEANGRDGEQRFVGVCGDVMKLALLEELASTSRQEFGGEPNLVVINAGRGLPGSVLESDDRQWSSLIQLNLLSVLQQMRWAGRLMRAAALSNGTTAVRDIVVIGSVVGRTVSSVNPVYGATKFAVHAAAEALRQELGKHLVRVTLIEPGFVRTEFQATAGYDSIEFDRLEKDLGPFLRPDDVARLVGFIVSQAAHVHINDAMIRPTRQAGP